MLNANAAVGQRGKLFSCEGDEGSEGGKQTWIKPLSHEGTKIF
jgi:hypothetical protein